ncbi:tRNA threonylcarbamoyladenosine biosynthesis protein TsaE [Flavobacterium longum]|uniref:tRNA (adenosine(37)-N6)-threonylcarbamoyltransferase complex ATPase subunit type 1 TsaE n=1 Tax=Flavobacterium longum TaxID=1299340 RepID=UPI0039E74DEF
MEITFSLDQIDHVAQQVLAANPEKVILFNGAMGAGKTTFIKALCRALGIDGVTSSPTFSLVNEYVSGSGDTVYHFDVYRLKRETEALDMGIEEYLYSGNYCFIEWAEKIPNLIPEAHSVIDVTVLSDGARKLRFRKN